MKLQESYVYIMANERPTLYTGVTTNLIQRVYQHKHKLIEGFTKKYNLTKLVYYEVNNDINEAIQREKQIKKWNREWKLNLIRRHNPNFRDLYEDLL